MTQALSHLTNGVTLSFTQSVSSRDRPAVAVEQTTEDEGHVTGEVAEGLRSFTSFTVLSYQRIIKQ